MNRYFIYFIPIQNVHIAELAHSVLCTQSAFTVPSLLWCVCILLFAHTHTHGWVCVCIQQDHMTQKSIIEIDQPRVTCANASNNEFVYIVRKESASNARLFCVCVCVCAKRRWRIHKQAKPMTMDSHANASTLITFNISVRFSFFFRSFVVSVWVYRLDIVQLFGNCASSSSAFVSSMRRADCVDCINRYKSLVHCIVMMMKSN